MGVSNGFDLFIVTEVTMDRVALISRIKFLSATCLIVLLWPAIICLIAMLYTHLHQIKDIGGAPITTMTGLAIALFVMVIGYVTSGVLWRYAREQRITMRR